MAQSTRALAAMPDDLSLIPVTHKLEGENQLVHVVPWAPHEPRGMTAHAIININEYNKNLKDSLNISLSKINCLASTSQDGVQDSIYLAPP